MREFNAHSPAIVIAGIAHEAGHRELIAARHKSRQARALIGVMIVRQIRGETAGRQQVELKAAEPLPGVERLLVHNHPCRSQHRIRERGQITVVGDVPVVGRKVVELRFLHVHMQRRIRIVSPIVRPHVNAVEKAVLRVVDGEIRAEKLRAGAEVHNAAVRVGASEYASLPAIAELDIARQPVFIRWNRRRSRGIGRSRRRGWSRSCTRSRRLLRRERAAESHRNQQASHRSRFLSTWLP